MDLPTPRRSRIALSAGAAAAALVLGAGCGQEEGRPLPATAARDIVARLDEVERRVDAGACNDIREDSVPALEREVDGLPRRVDASIRSTLADGLGRLEELVNAECRSRTPRPSPEPTAPTTPEPPVSTPPTPEEPVTEPPTQEPTPGGEDGGTGDGGGGTDGGGNGGDGGAGDGGGGGDGGSGSLPPGGSPGTGAPPNGGGIVTPPTSGSDST